MASFINLVSAFASWMADAKPIGGERGNQLARSDDTVLLAIHAHPGCSVSDVAQMIRLSHSGAVRIVDRLQRAALIERHTGQDRRQVSLVTTGWGADTASASLDARARMIRTRLQRLDNSELRDLERLLSKLMDGSASDRGEAWRICKACDHSVCRGDDCPVGRSFQ